MCDALRIFSRPHTGLPLEQSTNILGGEHRTISSKPASRFVLFALKFFFLVVADQAVILKVVMVQGNARVVDVLRSQPHLVVNDKSGSFVTRLAQPAVDADPRGDKRCPASLPLLAFIKPFGKFFCHDAAPSKEAGHQCASGVLLVRSVTMAHSRMNAYIVAR